MCLSQQEILEGGSLIPKDSSCHRVGAPLRVLGMGRLLYEERGIATYNDTLPNDTLVKAGAAHFTTHEATLVCTRAITSMMQGKQHHDLSKHAAHGKSLRFASTGT